MRKSGKYCWEVISTKLFIHRVCGGPHAAMYALEKNMGYIFPFDHL